MPKLRLAAGLLTVAALAVPAAAYASAYTPITYSDPARDVTGPSNTHYPEPALDIVGVHAERYQKNFSVVVSYRDLRALTYTRYLMYLADSSDSGREKVVELRASSPSSYRTTTVYYVKPSATEGAPASVAKVACSGARAVPNYTTNTITYTLPVSCYGLTPNSAILAASAGKWLQSTWQPGYVKPNDRPNLSDSAENTDGDAWAWTGETAARSAHHDVLLF